jgi:nitrate/nitrite transport system ATP-binding protein
MWMHPAMTEKFISIEGITKRFPAPGDGGTTVFEDLWLAMARGEFVCIIGHSGCGKTTVLNILAGLDVPSQGAVIVDNEAIEGPSLDRAVIFQSHALLHWLTVMGNRLKVQEGRPEPGPRTSSSTGRTR